LLISLLDIEQTTHEKRQREITTIPLSTVGSHGAPRAHAYEERSGEVRPGLYEREREREREREYTIIWNYQIILALFSIFFC